MKSTEGLFIRHGVNKDLAILAHIEQVSYPAAEAASELRIKQRLAVFPNNFWLLEEQNKVVAFVNGMVTAERDLTDEMYEYATMHKNDGPWQMIFSVVTTPKCRGKGYAGMLLQQVIAESKAAGRLGVVLTCKEKLLKFYGKFGFLNEGVSCSTHGAAVWYQMRLTF